MAGNGSQKRFCGICQELQGVIMNYEVDWFFWVSLNEISYVGDRLWCSWEAVFSILNHEIKELGLPLVIICPVSLCVTYSHGIGFSTVPSEALALQLCSILCCLLLQNSFTFTVLIRLLEIWRNFMMFELCKWPHETAHLAFARNFF